MSPEPDPKQPPKPPTETEQPKAPEAPEAPKPKVGAGVTLYRLGNGLTVVRSSGKITKLRAVKGSATEVLADVEIEAGGNPLIVEGAKLLDCAPDVEAVRYSPRFELVA